MRYYQCILPYNIVRVSESPIIVYSARLPHHSVLPISVYQGCYPGRPNIDWDVAFQPAKPEVHQEPCCKDCQ